MEPVSLQTLNSCTLLTKPFKPYTSSKPSTPETPRAPSKLSTPYPKALRTKTILYKAFGPF